jgi:hypothetical protein
MVSGVFASVSNVCFIYFQTYVAIIAFKCFKIRSSVTSPFTPFCCLASMSGTGRWRQSLLARADPTCLWGDATDETWAGWHGTRDGRQRRGRPDGGLASGCPGASHAPKTFTTSTMGISITIMAAAQ